MLSCTASWPGIRGSNRPAAFPAHHPSGQRRPAGPRRTDPRPGWLTPACPAGPVCRSRILRPAGAPLNAPAGAATSPAAARWACPASCFSTSAWTVWPHRISAPAKPCNLLEEIGLPPASIVIELTETRHTGRASAFAEALAYYRNMEFVALDDLGEVAFQPAPLVEWRPDFVKIDKYFVQNIHLDRAKQRFVQSMVEIGAATGSRLIAEGKSKRGRAGNPRTATSSTAGLPADAPSPARRPACPPEIRMLLQPSAHLPLRQRATAGELCFSPPVMPPTPSVTSPACLRLRPAPVCHPGGQYRWPAGRPAAPSSCA